MVAGDSLYVVCIYIVLVMFLFESRQQKQTRERVQRSMEICMSNSKKYAQSKDVLVNELRRSDQKVIEMIVDNIKSTIKNEEFQPVRKYQAMLLLKDLMLTHNKALGKYVVKKILKRLIILAQHKTGGKGDDREEEHGKDIFGTVKKDQEQYAAKFFNTLLTALQEWGKNWPKASDGPYNSFHKEYNELLMNGVQFPKVRPKQAPPKQTSGRLSREEARNSMENTDISPGKSIQKSPPPRTQQIKPPPKRPSNRDNAGLKANIAQFYQKIKEPLNFLSQILPSCEPQTIPMIQDIVQQFAKDMEIGNDLIISIENDEQFNIDSMKIKKCFDFQEKIKKDLSIMAKKPGQSEIFKNKYIKLCRQLLDTLKKNADASVSQVTSNSNIVTDQSISPKPAKPAVSQQAMKGEKVEEKPKIINKNRYTSVQGQQVLPNFDKQTYNSKGGESVHSDRFGSFGGPNDRHRASNPFQANSPQNPKRAEGANSDKKEQSNRSQKNPPIKPIPEQKTIQLSKAHNVSKQTEKSDQKKQESHQRGSLDNIFKQFQIEKPKKESEKGSTSNLQPKFADNDSFGANQFGGKSKLQQQQQDFFAKLEQNEKEPTKALNANLRRKKPLQRQEHQDAFKVKIDSKVDSSLSGFEFSQKMGDASKNDSRNAVSPIQTEQQIKKEKVLENPFEQQNFQDKSRNSQNFFNQFDRSQRSNLFGNSTVTQKIKTQNDEHQNKVSQKHFQTGNFGNMVASKPQLNPFDAQSVRSKKQFNSNENPFGNDSFDRINKSNKEQNKSIHSNKVGNPFQSKIHDPNQAIFQSNVYNSINAVNPFQSSSQKSHKRKNVFDEVEQYFQPASKANIEGLSQRGSFKQINGQTQIIRQNFTNNLQEPIRDSLIFSAKVGRDSEQHGLNFSQFEDIGGPEAKAANPFAESSELRNSNPFNQSGESKKKEQFSGFSLSNFPGVGETEQKIEKKEPVANNSVADFFGNFQHQSISKRPSIERKEQPKQKVNFFDDFNMDKSVSGEKSQKRKSTQNIPNNFIERQKTVLSGEQKSFNFQQLDQYSAIQKKKSIKKQDADEFNPIHNTSRTKKDREGFAIENQNQKSVGWSDFDPQTGKSQLDRGENQKPQSQVHSQRLLEVQSRLRDNPNSHPDRLRTKQVSLANSKASKNLQQNSINLNLQDFAPISKKGIQWNPLSKLSKLRPSPFTYSIIEDKQILLKRHQLLQKQREYGQKLQIFKFARHKNDQIRNIYVQKMRRLEEVVEQKGQYMQMLKKIKETNDLKEKEVEVLHQKLKKAQELKEKILLKEREFYQLTKNQNYAEEKKNVNQRSMANKWQMFNKNLQNNRNSIATMHSQHSHYY